MNPPIPEMKFFNELAEKTESVQSIPKILRPSKIPEFTGLKRTAIDERAKDGKFPDSFDLGGKAVGYLEHEIVAWIRAKAAGYNDTQIKQLVSKMKEDRATSLNHYLSPLENKSQTSMSESIDDIVLSLFKKNHYRDLTNSEQQLLIEGSTLAVTYLSEKVKDFLAEIGDKPITFNQEAQRQRLSIALDLIRLQSDKIQKVHESRREDAVNNAISQQVTKCEGM